MDVLPAVRVKGRKQAEALVHRPARQPGKKHPQFLRLMIAAVDLRCDLQCLLTDAMHKQVGFTAAPDRPPAVQMFQESFQIHSLLSLSYW